MNLRLIQALTRHRLRRRLMIETARLEEMRENAKETIAAQERAVEQALRRYDAEIGESAIDIANRIDRASKAGLLAA
ncbi:hypothetical protein [Aromatoleum toluclasticum]|uniref:hypothetical protein n=1 Tax=Aromatoleum toluclasticum TaxID=92003 RepID=UPI00036D89FC|nr:hypothetical protein [Aromatoleum toluclasticum]